jgi:TRAP-type C4-dicarboxylate transport system permease small subunit
MSFRNGIVKTAAALEKVIYPLSRWISYVAMAAVMMMTFLVTVDVFMRRAFNSPILGSYEIGKVLLVIVVFFGVAYVMTIKGHVVVDTLTRLYPAKLQKIANSTALFLSLLIISLICWQSTIYGLESFRIGETSVLLRIVVSPFIFIVAFGSLVLFLVILVQFIYSLAGIDMDSDPTCAC